VVNEGSRRFADGWGSCELSSLDMAPFVILLGGPTQFVPLGF